MKILLTGAAGFIGAKVGEKLLAAGHRVHGVDDLNDYYDVRLKDWRLSLLKGLSEFSFTKLDIAEFGAVEAVVSTFKPDVIINLAARAGVRYSMENPFVYFRTNAGGTLNLLEIARKYGVKKFILASTSSLYAGQKMPFVEDLPVNEPISPYAASKKAAEVTSYTYHYLYDINVTVFRYFTVYGPCGRPDMSVFRFIKWIDEGRHIKMFGDGSQSRDFTYVDDIAEGTVRGIPLTGFQIINLGGHKPYTLMQAVALMEKYLGRKAQIDHESFHKADMMATWADISRAENLLGWHPAVGLEEGIKRAVEWYLENKSWLKDIELTA